MDFCTIHAVCILQYMLCKFSHNLKRCPCRFSTAPSDLKEFNLLAFCIESISTFQSTILFPIKA